MERRFAVIGTVKMEAMGVKLRRRRRRLGLTLDELSVKTGISKPYLSLIENSQVPNPPSDAKIRKLEEALEFRAGELVTQAHLMRTPKDVRVVLGRLMEAGRGNGRRANDEIRMTNQIRNSNDENGGALAVSAGINAKDRDFAPLNPEGRDFAPLNLDDAYLSGVLQQMVEEAAGNIEKVASNAVPVINRVSAGYPKDFTDLSYPKGVADDYLSCPEVSDADAFAARVSGDSMTPKYREGDIVIFSPAAATKSGDDCFVRFADGHTTFKRVFFEKGEKGEMVIRLQPRNEKYRAQMVGCEEVNGVYKAVFKYQRVDE